METHSKEILYKYTDNRRGTKNSTFEKEKGNKLEKSIRLRTKYTHGNALLVAFLDSL
ncbi:hypothetical protein [Candidatus Mycoplasma haematohominis]|uniref:hypothetical protein n=1 Tax=Candidatus Mycoplasma haematohominis TaxID=1494318 RepID=UPI001C0A72EE|nr:hypothetical protein [Candidatus Mycoplasma haemohominis]